MATYGRKHGIIIQDDIELMRDQVRRDMFDGAEAATLIVLKHPASTVDEFTLEVTAGGADILEPISGIIGLIAEEDDLLAQAAGRVKVGDVSVLYHYEAISGVMHHSDINQIRLNVPAASGLYNVVGRHVTTLSNTPILIKFALNLDDSGTS